MSGTTTVGKFTGHGTPLGPGPGSHNVILSGRRLWRIGYDFHSCPLVSGSAHVGGKVMLGKNRVMVNSFLMATEGDLIFEVSGPPNPIMPSPI